MDLELDFGGNDVEYTCWITEDELQQTILYYGYTQAELI